jgi:hypothetical protein
VLDTNAVIALVKCQRRAKTDPVSPESTGRRHSGWAPGYVYPPQAPTARIGSATRRGIRRHPQRRPPRGKPDPCATPTIYLQGGGSQEYSQAHRPLTRSACARMWTPYSIKTRRPVSVILDIENIDSDALADQVDDDVITSLRRRRSRLAAGGQPLLVRRRAGHPSVVRRHGASVGVRPCLASRARFAPMTP